MACSIPASSVNGIRDGHACTNFFIVLATRRRQSVSGWRLIDRNGRVTIVFDVEVDGPGVARSDKLRRAAPAT